MRRKPEWPEIRDKPICPKIRSKINKLKNDA